MASVPLILTLPWELAILIVFPDAEGPNSLVRSTFTVKIFLVTSYSTLVPTVSDNRLTSFRLIKKRVILLAKTAYHTVVCHAVITVSHNYVIVERSADTL